MRQEAIRCKPALAILAGVMLAAAMAAEARGAAPRHLLWRLPKADGGSMYLLGSIHFSNDSLYPLPPVIEEAFAGCRTLVLEVDMGSVQTPAFAWRMMQAGMYPEGESLTDHLRPETWTLVERECSRAGMAAERVRRFRPWYCANQLMVSALRRAGFNPTLGLDQHFYRQALRDGKAVVGLESPDFQLGLLAGLSGSEADEFMQQALLEAADIRSFAERVLALWRAGDAAAIGAMVTAGFRGADELFDKVFTQRNQAWSKRLQELAASSTGDVFVVVGAGHLHGDDGVVSLLSKAGLDAEQL